MVSFQHVKGLVILCFSGKDLTPNDKFPDLSELKAFTDDKLNAIKNLKFALGMVENIVRKGENAGYQHSLLLPQCFQKASFSRSLSPDCVVKGY